MWWPDDDAVAQVGPGNSSSATGFVHALQALVARDAVDRDGRCVLAAILTSAANESFRTIPPSFHGDGADRNYAVGPRIQAGRFGVEDDVSHLIDRVRCRFQVAVEREKR